VLVYAIVGYEADSEGHTISVKCLLMNQNFSCEGGYNVSTKGLSVVVDEHLHLHVPFYKTG
jgi:hypothetical protein